MNESRSCLVCGGTFLCVHKSRAGKYCSKKCEGIASTGKPNTECSECGKSFHLKESQKRGPRKLGFFCSISCMSKAKSRLYSGASNPNFRGRHADKDGYKFYPPSASNYLDFKGMKIHQAVCCSVLGIKKLPKTLHIHHRDCDILNNVSSNLSVMTASEHKWMHHQFGFAVLRAMCKGLITAETLAEWSDDKEIALRLLNLDIDNQSASTQERSIIESHYESQIKTS